MLDSRDLELFGLFATSFVLRGRRSWHCAELVDRLEALGLPTDCQDALKNICSAGWLTEAREDVFELTEAGVGMARYQVEPYRVGDTNWP